MYWGNLEQVDANRFILYIIYTNNLTLTLSNSEQFFCNSRHGDRLVSEFCLTAHTVMLQLTQMQRGDVFQPGDTYIAREI